MRQRSNYQRFHLKLCGAHLSPLCNRAMIETNASMSKTVHTISQRNGLSAPNRIIKKKQNKTKQKQQNKTDGLLFGTVCVGQWLGIVFFLFCEFTSCCFLNKPNKGKLINWTTSKLSSSRARPQQQKVKMLHASVWVRIARCAHRVQWDIVCSDGIILLFHISMLAINCLCMVSAW